MLPPPTHPDIANAATMTLHIALTDRLGKQNFGDAKVLVYIA